MATSSSAASKASAAITTTSVMATNINAIATNTIAIVTSSATVTTTSAMATNTSATTTTTGISQIELLCDACEEWDATEVARILTASKNKIDLETQRSDDGEGFEGGTLLLRVCTEGNGQTDDQHELLKTVRTLLKAGASPDAVAKHTFYGKVSPVTGLLCYFEGQFGRLDQAGIETLVVLIQAAKQPIPDCLRNDNGKRHSALHQCCLVGDVQSAAALVLYGGANINCPDTDGCTAFELLGKSEEDHHTAIDEAGRERLQQYLHEMEQARKAGMGENVLQLIGTLFSGGPRVHKSRVADYPGRFSYESLDFLNELDEKTKASVLTVSNTKFLLTQWPKDPVNDPFSFVDLQSIPPALIITHASDILANRDDVCADQYGWHEQYRDAWDHTVEVLGHECPALIKNFVQNTLLPRLEGATVHYVKAKTASGKPPDLFQEPIYDTAAMLGAVATEDPTLLGSAVERLAEVLHPHWNELIGAGLYRCADIKALRSTLQGAGVEADIEAPPKKRQRAGE